MAIASNDHVYVWYKDGTVSAGTSKELDTYRTPYAYSLPPGKQAGDVIGIGIASNDHVYVWYKDGTVSAGTSKDLDAYLAPYAYSLPPGKQAGDVIGIGIASNDHVYVWYKDGTVSAGTSKDLDAYRAPYPYRQHLLIRSWWGPEQRLYALAPALLSLAPVHSRDDVLEVERAGAREGARSVIPGRDVRITPQPSGSGATTLDPSVIAGVPALADALASDQSPAPAAVPFAPGIEGVDPMVAVGNNFLIISQQGTLGFFDRNGNPLPSKHGEKTSLSANEFFAAFIAADSVTDINRYNGFPKPCDDPSYPDTRNGRKFCVAEVYDLRTMFDAAGKRFVVYANMRNAIWTEAFRKSLSAGEDCGLYDPTWPKGDEVTIQWSSDPANWCRLARRHVAIGVSKTEDPRDGFYLYALTQNNYRDFPWATINGDSLVIANRGTEMPDGPVATVLSLAALQAGAERPPYSRYYKSDVNGHERVLLPVHHGSPNGLTLMIGGKGGSQIRVFGFPPPSAPYARPPLYSTVVNVKPMFPAVYRNGFLHFAEHHDTELSPNSTPRYNIRIVRVPLWAEGSGPTLALKSSMSPAKGFIDKSFGKNGPGDSPGDIVSYEVAALAVNKHGDMFIAYGRYPVSTQNPLYPEVRYTVWYHDEPQQRRSNVLKKGEGAASQSPAFLDYATAVMDPLDDETIWVAHEYGSASGYKTVVGRVRP